jgi:hypothetical protein
MYCKQAANHSASATCMKKPCLERISTLSSCAQHIHPYADSSGGHVPAKHGLL